ncbi:hypothetical protein FVE85_7177 [Porphyridium purpureum]|uniref:Uncharacterized protein n=1 Tax=Porphyridium purpureum TaxID=35688 RepID=A0A5J4Z951_PORPP|nr:hypothetical protein FVE85_7177 [Porphyridium purpureum]|eukprot:POR0529..scf295_1
MRASDAETEADFQVRAEVDPNADVLTQMQQRLHEISAQMMTYVGILQRDAPAIYRENEPASGSAGAPPAKVKIEASPASPRSSDTRFVQNMLLERALSQAKVYASDIVTTSKRIDVLIGDAASEIEANAGREDEALRQALEARAAARVRYDSVLVQARQELGRVTHASLTLEKTETLINRDPKSSANTASEHDDRLVQDDFSSEGEGVMSPRTRELDLDEEDDMDVDSFL